MNPSHSLTRDCFILFLPLIIWILRSINPIVACLFTFILERKDSRTKIFEQFRVRVERSPTTLSLPVKAESKFEEMNEKPFCGQICLAKRNLRRNFRVVVNFSAVGLARCSFVLRIFDESEGGCSSSSSWACTPVEVIPLSRRTVCPACSNWNNVHGQQATHR